MRQETLEQILKVIALAAQRHNKGDGINRSYQYGVKSVSQEYGITYQTVADACRRRLGLSNVDEFKRILKTCLDGDQAQLRDLLLRKNPQLRKNIDDFFLDLTADKDTSMIQEADTSVVYSIEMRKSDSDVLMALAQLLGREPEKLLIDIAVDAIKDRMKKTVSQL